MVTTCWEDVVCDCTFRISGERQLERTQRYSSCLAIAMECGFQIRFKLKLCSYWLVTGFCKTKRRLTENSYLHQLERQKHSVGIPRMKNSGLQSWLSPIQIVRRLWNSWSWPQLQRCSKILHCRSVSLCCVDSKLQYVKDIQGYESKKDLSVWLWGRRWLGHPWFRSRFCIK